MNSSEKYSFEIIRRQASFASLPRTKRGGLSAADERVEKEFFSRAVQYAIKSLTHKRQSETQIREKILRYYPEVDIERVMERLRELNYVNDREFCEAWIRYRSLSSPRGRYALDRELQKKGIPLALRQEALAKHEEADDLKQLAEQRWKKIREGNDFKKRQKLQRFLLSRGFTISEVIEVVNSVARTPKDC